MISHDVNQLFILQFSIQLELKFGNSPVFTELLRLNLNMSSSVHLLIAAVVAQTVVWKLPWDPCNPSSPLNLGESDSHRFRSRTTRKPGLFHVSVSAGCPAASQMNQNPTSLVPRGNYSNGNYSPFEQEATRFSGD